MKLLREYIRESLILERGDADYKAQMVTDIAVDVRIVNDAIESLHPAHAIPNSEHVEGSIGEALDLISLKKKYGRSRNEHAAQQLLDMWRSAMGAGGGKKGAAVGFLLAAGGAALADHIFLGGALTYLGLGGAGLNTIYEVMAGNAADDDLKKYIKWDPEILGWMDDKKEDELEDEWIDLLFEHISNNPQSDLTDFMSINDFANEKLGRPLKGEKIRIRTNELREYIRELLTEGDDYDDDSTSMEANLAMLVFRDEVDQALMMFEMLAPMNELNLDLLATELDNRLLPEWDKIPERPPANVPLGARSPEWKEYTRVIDDWAWKLEEAIRFITGNYVNRSFRPPQNVYKLGSIKDTILMALRQTTSVWRKKNESTP